MEEVKTVRDACKTPDLEGRGQNTERAVCVQEGIHSASQLPQNSSKGQ